MIYLGVIVLSNLLAGLCLVRTVRTLIIYIGVVALAVLACYSVERTLVLVVQRLAGGC